jgi:hypothetical protein
VALVPSPLTTPGTISMANEANPTGTAARSLDRIDVSSESCDVVLSGCCVVRSSPGPRQGSLSLAASTWLWMPPLLDPPMCRSLRRELRPSKLGGSSLPQSPEQAADERRMTFHSTRQCLSFLYSRGCVEVGPARGAVLRPRIVHLASPNPCSARWPGGLNLLDAGWHPLPGA